MEDHAKKATGNYGPVKGEFLYGPVATVFASSKTGTWRIVRPDVDHEECSLCATCQNYCPTDVVSVHSDNRAEKVTFDLDYCKGCGICANLCPKHCITMVPESEARA